MYVTTYVTFEERQILIGFNLTRFFFVIIETYLSQKKVFDVLKMMIMTSQLIDFIITNVELMVNVTNLLYFVDLKIIFDVTTKLTCVSSK